MERIEEWSKQLRKELEKIAAFLQRPKSSSMHIGQPKLEEITNTLEEKTLRIFHKIEHGLQKIIETLPEMFGSYKDPSAKELVQSLGELITVATLVVQDPGRTLTSMSQGQILQEVLGLATNTIESMYKVAKYLYDNQQYEEAASAFCLLTLLNPSYSSFWQGLGNSEYFLRRYREALIAYNCAVQMEPDDPLPLLLSTKCHMALEHYPAAKATLVMAAAMKHSRSFQQQIDRLNEELRRFLT